VSLYSTEACSEKRLTIDIAIDFLANPSALDTSKYTHIDLDAASILSKYRGEQLDLRGILTLSSELANKLSAFSGNQLMFGIETLIIENGALAVLDDNYRGKLITLGFHTAVAHKAINDSDLEYLNKNNFQVLNLYYIRNFNQSLANRLRKFGGSWIQVIGVEHLNARVIEALSKFKGDVLSLSHLKTISDTAAKHLSNFQGHTIHLFHLTTLSIKSASFLSQFRGKELYLNGLHEISVELAEALLHCQGTLVLQPKHLLEIQEMAKKILGVK